MKKKALVFCLFLTLPAVAQVEMQEPSLNALSHFYFDALNFKADQNKSRLDFYLQVPYGEIQFIKYGNEFIGSYEITIRLIDDDGNQALDETWEERPTCESFEETNSRMIYSSSEKQFIVKPGAYTLQVALTDSETNKSFTEKRDFVARDYADSSVSLSDVMLLKASSISEGKETIIPSVDGNVISQSDSFPVFYEVYFPKPNDSAFVTTDIFGEKNRLMFSTSKWNKGIGKTEAIIAEIPKDSLPMGLYKLSISLRESADKEVHAKANASRIFSIHFPDLPVTITDLDKAAEEMMYIANSSVIDSIKSAPNMFAKEKLFLSFWQKYNPNRSSKNIPIMNEYFDRVAYANAHFSHYFKGWKTDMGMIYIIFGQPNSVDRHPFEGDSKPYEVWDYYQRNRQFVFVDETGFGDYKLMNPLSDINGPPYGPDFFGR